MAVTIVTFVIFFIVPAEPARLCAGHRADRNRSSAAGSFLGLDQPLYAQYGRYMKRLVVERSLGKSFATRQDVNQIVVRAAPVTASLVFGGALLWLLLAVPMGILSALRPRSLLDRGHHGLRHPLDHHLQPCGRPRVCLGRSSHQA
ncbi:MAG: hypothetical protein H0V11_06045 [Actinobacteria bacterium]|nr:hypothetical protein [Actinomycetota bacterium]